MVLVKQKQTKINKAPQQTKENQNAQKSKQYSEY
jgi:hypothetical protein